MALRLSYKTFLMKYAILLGFFAVMFLILIYAVKLSAKSWQNNLQSTIEKVLEENSSNTWQTESYVKIKNPLALNAACFEVRNRKNGEVYKAVIIRVATLYGPIPAVFTVSDDSIVSFIGYSNIHGRISDQLSNDFPNMRIEYWKTKILDILDIN